MAVRAWVTDSRWVLLGRASALLSALALNATLAHLLPAPQLGSYFLWASAAAAMGVLASFGLGPVALRHIAVSRRNGRSVEASDFAHAALGWGLRGGLAASAAFLAAAALVTGEISAAMAAACLIVALAVSGLLAELLRGFGDLRAAALLSELFGGWLGLAAIWALDALRPPLAVPGAIAALALGLAGASAYGRLALCRHLTPAPTAPSPFSWWWRESRAVWLNTGLWLVLGQADLWVLGAFRPRAEVAVYGIASRVAMLLLQPDAMARTLLMPRAAALHASGDLPGLQRLVRGAATVTGALVATGAIALAIGGAWFLTALFGAPYRACLPLVLILSCGYVVNSLSGLAATTLLMSGHQARVLRASLLGSALTLILLFALTPPFGAPGAASAVAMGFVVQNALMVALARRTLGIWTTASARPSEWRTLWVALRAPAPGAGA
ncbi:MAG: polysaccharide biosynthesis C-terminal domain-containing protein [Acidobacteria bacterium]|nr:polysaccharide biosynthesis C-terminal domain-containing protein [Acidobacteriota bacterium]